MATKHTANYQLNLWEPNDSFLRTEFNENSNRIDAAIAALSDKTDAQLLPRPRIATGSYVGNGATTKTIDFGVPAKVVFITMSYATAQFTILIRGQTAGANALATEESLGFNISWGTNSVTLASRDTARCYCMNTSGYNYHWCVLY